MHDIQHSTQTKARRFQYEPARLHCEQWGVSDFILGKNHICDFRDANGAQENIRSEYHVESSFSLFSSIYTNEMERVLADFKTIEIIHHLDDHCSSVFRVQFIGKLYIIDAHR